MRKITIVTSFGFCLLIFLACRKDEGKLPVEPAPLPVNACDTITYDKHIKPIIQAKCNSCHAPGTLSSGFDLSTYTLFKAKASDGKIKKRVIDDLPPASMPQGSAKLPQAQLDLIQCWLNNGMKEK